MSVMTYNFTRQDLSDILRQSVNDRIIRALEQDYAPWQKPWEGRGCGVGFPRDARTKKKFFGVNFLLLQMSAREHGFISSWWGTSDQFAAFGSKVKPRPEQVVPGGWGTETVFYKLENYSKVLLASSVIFNADQLELLLEDFRPNPTLMPTYVLAEKILHSTNAKIKFNTSGEAWYFYPPHDYITLPKKQVFESGLGGLPGYYESLAHELVHWTEPRLGFDTESDEAIRELRADIGAAMLMEELGVPHSISFSNYHKWRSRWINALKNDVNVIFRACASASKAVDYITSFSIKTEDRFNQIDERAA